MRLGVYAVRGAGKDFVLLKQKGGRVAPLIYVCFGGHTPKRYIVKSTLRYDKSTERDDKSIEIKVVGAPLTGVPHEPAQSMASGDLAAVPPPQIA